jgi:hypothetical protein
MMLRIKPRALYMPEKLFTGGYISILDKAN